MLPATSQGVTTSRNTGSELHPLTLRGTSGRPGFEDFETVEASPTGWSLDGGAGSQCGQGLTLLVIQLNMSSSIHRMTRLNS